MQVRKDPEEGYLLRPLTLSDNIVEVKKICGHKFFITITRMDQYDEYQYLLIITDG